MKYPILLIATIVGGLFSLRAAPANAQRTETNEDYPIAALRDHAEGVAEFEVLVGKDGNPKECHITKSAGHPALDDATCKVIMKRGNWKPARDANGNMIESRYTNRFTWVIPD